MRGPAPMGQSDASRHVTLIPAQAFMMERERHVAGNGGCAARGRRLGSFFVQDGARIAIAAPGHPDEARQLFRQRVLHITSVRPWRTQSQAERAELTLHSSLG